jgi:sulfhydrogenase subunit beta (sulfur reductase)
MIREGARTLKKERLEGFLQSLLRDRTVFGPVKKGQLVLLESIHSADDLILGQGKTKNSPKNALFPQAERLFTYRKEGQGITLDPPFPGGKKQALFGVRPCDVRAFLLLDSVFTSDKPDPYYADRRSNTVVVSLACTHPDAACFCQSLGGGPCSSEGSDLLMFDLGDQYLVEGHSAQGRLLLENDFFGDADDEAIAGAEQARVKAEASMDPIAATMIVTAGELQKKLADIFDDSIWSELTESCISCGVCTYLCPTCHCFDICDEASPDAGERIRIWDSCQSPLFTQQASGFNPRPSAKERYRQRIMHKFSYLRETGNMTGCVGCGRCVTECPVNLDIREVLEKVAMHEAG